MTLRALVRSLLAPVVVLAGYLLLRAVFDAQTEHGGLVSPSGSVSLGLVLLGGVVLVLRIVVLFGLPAWLVYRGVTRLLGRRS